MCFSPAILGKRPAFSASSAPPFTISAPSMDTILAPRRIRLEIGDPILAGRSVPQGRPGDAVTEILSGFREELPCGGVVSEVESIFWLGANLHGRLEDVEIRDRRGELAGIARRHFAVPEV